MLTHEMVRLLPDGRAVMRVVETETEYIAKLGFVPGNGNNLVAYPDATAQEIPTTDPAEVDAARVSAEAATERLREERTREARGLPAGTSLPPEHQAPTAMPDAEPPVVPEPPAEQPEPAQAPQGG